ncbi:hypothetical protein SLEP1_g58242 [Rubroshorea leprosula]|uniref:BED-type domain-containing protein n=1 Tax=Rubroshorea leprosula TaxID=152421 RepID=A0AAV5MSR3_9ROSI|nr:hypothetical protein SLEP1_g58242 [Rubroshorea leprosula]
MKRKQSQGNGNPSQIPATKQGTPPPSQPEIETVMDLIHVGEDNENNRAISSDLEKNEVAPFSKKKKKSKVWDDFQLIEAHLNDDGLERGKCKYCGTTYICEGKYGTSNMKRHLSKCFARVNRNPVQMMLSNSGKLVRKIDQETFKELCALVVIEHSYPFSWVEHKAVRSLMKYLNEDVKPICRNTVKNCCLKIHQRERDRIKQLLKKVSRRICLTCDMWTSAFTQGYLCLTAHFLGDEWNLHSLILNFLHVPPPHTARILFKQVYELLKEWSIESKIFSITLDNARCNDNMQEALRNQLNLERPLLSSGDYFHIRCSAHILNLIVQEGLKVIDDSVRKLRDGIKYITATEGRMLNFEECAKRASCDLSKGLWLDCRLWLDCPTRWNSTHKMLERAVIYKDVFASFELDDENFKWTLDEEEWKRVGRICELLQPFSEISTLFSGSKYPTSNLYFKHVWKIELCLLENIKCGDIYIRDMATSMKAKFEKYWDSYSLILAFAIILDPRYKLSFVTYCYKILNEETYTAKVNHVTDKLYQLYNEYVMEGSKLESTNNATMPTTTVTEVVGNKDRLMEGFENFDMEKVHTSQLRQYLEEGRQPHRQPLDILEFWKQNERRLPDLARMARDILSIPITTVASESAFSMGGHVLTKLRGSLLPENAEALITTRTWLNGFQKEGDNTATGHAEDEVLGYEYQVSGCSAVANN